MCYKSCVILSDEIKLSFNIDGLPLHKSSSVQFWPILASLVHNHGNSKPFIVGIFCGNSKPKPLTLYLEDFVSELNNLLQFGIEINNKKFSVLVHSFICDMPAKSYIKCVKSHNGYSLCDKCTCVGSYINDRVVLDNLQALRNDEDFMNQTNEEHHTGHSSLSTLPTGLVTRFPIDYMHSVCLGVMRKLLQ